MNTSKSTNSRRSDTQSRKKLYAKLVSNSSKPSSSKPISSKPSSSKPISSKPISSKPISSKPISSKPISSKPSPSYSNPSIYQSYDVIGNSGNWPIKNDDNDCLIEAFVAYLYFIPNNKLDNEIKRIVNILMNERNLITEITEEDITNKKRIDERIGLIYEIKGAIKLIKKFGDSSQLNDIAHGYAKKIKSTCGVSENHFLEVDVIFGANLYYCDSNMNMFIDGIDGTIRTKQLYETDIIVEPIKHYKSKIYIEILNDIQTHFYCIVNIKGELYEIESLGGGKITRISKYPQKPIMVSIEIDEKYENEVRALINKFIPR